jgi:DNA invertase Pin-like site-specific DNA recombinase
VVRSLAERDAGRPLKDSETFFEVISGQKNADSRKALLAALKTGRRLWCESASRLARSPKVAEEILGIAEKHGCEIVFADLGSLVGDGSAGRRFMFRVMIAQSALERDSIEERTSDGTRRALAVSTKTGREGRAKLGGRRTVLEDHPRPRLLATEVLKLHQKFKPGSYGWRSMSKALAKPRGRKGTDTPLLTRKLDTKTVKGLLHDSQMFLKK